MPHWQRLAAAATCVAAAASVGLAWAYRHRHGIRRHVSARIISVDRHSPSARPAPIPVNGGERVAWDQLAEDRAHLSTYRFIAFVDDAPQLLAGVTCTRARAGTFSCSAPLPDMAGGATHKLELAASSQHGIQGAKSSAIYVVTSRSTTSASRPH